MTTTLSKASFQMTPEVIDQERSLAKRLVSLHGAILDKEILKDLTSDNPANVHIGLELIKPWLILRKQEREAAVITEAINKILPQAEERYKALKARVRYAPENKRPKIREFYKRFEAGFSSVEELQRWIKEADDKIRAIEIHRRGTSAPKGVLGHVHSSATVDWSKQDGIKTAPASYRQERIQAGTPKRGVTQPVKRKDGKKVR